MMNVELGYDEKVSENYIDTIFRHPNVKIADGRRMTQAELIRFLKQYLVEKMELYQK